jgi:hypothetical protein
VGQNEAQTKGQVLTQLVDIELKMMSLNFSGHGSIYLKQDLCDGPSIPMSINPSLAEYVLGPSVGRSWWEKERNSMSIDRGPCNYPFDIAKNRDTFNGGFKSKGSKRTSMD